MVGQPTEIRPTPTVATVGPPAGTASAGVTELFTRSQHNPLLSAADWPYPVGAVFNPAAATVDGQTVLLCRVEDRRGISHLTVARSEDGVTGWRVDPTPLIGPDQQHARWGVEDPRVTWLSDRWLISYTAYGPDGPAVAMAATTDFVTVEPLGVVRPPADKNAALLPRRLDGQYVLLHRPTSNVTGRSDVWLSRSPDLRTWSAPQPVFAARPGGWWDSVRIGIGPPPLWTPHGWLGLYHGIKRMAGGLVYRVGVVLLDAADPARVRRRGDEWLLAPQAPYERTGDAPNVVFPTGMIHDVEEDRLRIYYGAADTYVAMATCSYSELVNYVLTCPEPSPDGGG